MKARFALPCLLAASVAYAQNSPPPHAFDYDRKAAIDVQEVGVKHRGDIAIHDISYASPKGGRVPAYLVVPEGNGPFAAVIWGHWYWSNSAFFSREEFLDEAVALAQAGVVSLLTTGPGARPGHVDDPDPMSDRQMAELIQQIVDMRRGADLLLARSDVDPQRLAYVGHSYDGTVGGFLSGVDKRFKAFVLMAAGLSDEVDMKTEEFRQFRQKYGPEKFDQGSPSTAGWTLESLFRTPHRPPCFYSSRRRKTSSLPIGRVSTLPSSVIPSNSSCTTRPTHSTPKPGETASLFYPNNSNSDLSRPR
jgi:hypothetical protein